MSTMLSLARTAAALSDRYRMRITAEPGGAYCRPDDKGDGYVINIPLTEDADNPDHSILVAGYVDHEAGHCRFSDFKVLGQSTSNVHKCLTNIFEDVRIERRMGALYPGCASNLLRLSTHVFKDKPDLEDASPLARVCNAILYNVRARINPELEADAQARVQTIPQDVVDLLDQVDTLTSSKDAAQLAQDVLDRLQDEPQGQAQAQDQGDAGETGDMSEDMSDAEVREMDMSALAEAEMGETMTTHGRMLHSSADPEASSCDQIVGTMDTCDMQEARACASRLEARLRSLAQAKVLNRGGSGRRGKLDPHKLYRLAQGSDRIFLRRIERVGVDTELILLADGSGSMYGSDARLESMAVYALRMACKGIQGLQCRAFVFGGSTMDEMRETDGVANAGGSTPGGAAAARALGMFSFRRCKQVLVLMTDGQLDDTTHFIAVREAAKRAGITVLGIGMGIPLEGLLPEGDHTYIASLSELPQALFSLAEGRVI